MDVVGTGLDGGIEHRAGGTAELSAEVGGLDIEFLDRVNRRKNGEVRSVEEVDRVGVIVDAVEQIVVLRGTQPFAVKAPEAALPRVSACGVLTPAPSWARKVKLRPLSGRLLTLCSLTTWPTEPSSVCNCGGAVLTSPSRSRRLSSIAR